MNCLYSAELVADYLLQNIPLDGKQHRNPNGYRQKDSAQSVAGECEYEKCPLHNTDNCWIDTTHDKYVCFIYVASCNGYKDGHQDGIAVGIKQGYKKALAECLGYNHNKEK